MTDATESREATAKSLDLAGEAAWIAGDYDEAFRLRERAHSRYLDEGGEAKAALVAAILSIDYYQRGDLAVGAGWQGAAERLLDGKPKSRGHGFVTSIRSQIALLFQKDVEVAAVALIEQAVADETLELARTDLLSARVEIALAAGDFPGARSAAAELAEISTRFGTGALAASAASAEGRLRPAAGDAAAALPTLKRAQRLWHVVGVPYEEARARVLLADAHLALGDEEQAALELRAAHATFERLGAVADDRRATATLRALAGAVETAASDAASVVRTFMFTDIVDSTPLVEAIGDDAWLHIRRWHDETLRALFADHRGEEVDHAGDGFFVAFESSARAVSCAVEIQRTLAEHRRAHGFSPRVRIGMHSSSAIRRGSGYGGKGVHTAARIGAHAGGGEILASAETLGQAATALPTTERRAVKLKGIAAPVEVVSVVWA